MPRLVSLPQCVLVSSLCPRHRSFPPAPDSLLEAHFRNLLPLQHLCGASNGAWTLPGAPVTTRPGTECPCQPGPYGMSIHGIAGLPESQHLSDVQPSHSKIVTQWNSIQTALLGYLSILPPKMASFDCLVEEHKKEGTGNLLLLLFSISASTWLILGCCT